VTKKVVGVFVRFCAASVTNVSDSRTDFKYLSKFIADNDYDFQKYPILLLNPIPYGQEYRSLL
jgi:hypothetical protein